MLVTLLAAAALSQSKSDFSYTESITNPDGTIAMRTRAVKLTSEGKPDVWLVGAVHIGTKAYYSQVQTLLNAQNAVLFEGVKPSANATMPLKPATDSKSIYKILGDAIGLDFQLNDIDYNHPNWIDSDLTWGEITDLNSKFSKGKPNQIDTIKKLMDPKSPSVQMFSNLLKSVTPGTREAFKIMMVKTVASGNGPSLDPTTTQVVVTERNKSVLNHFATLVKGTNTPRSVGIFYGALHLPGIEHDLAEKYGYKFSSQEWFTSATADPKKVDATGKAMLDAFQKMSKNGFANFNLPTP